MTRCLVLTPRWTDIMAYLPAMHSQCFTCWLAGTLAVSAWFGTGGESHRGDLQGFQGRRCFAVVHKPPEG